MSLVFMYLANHQLLNGVNRHKEETLKRVSELKQRTQDKIDKWYLQTKLSQPFFYFPDLSAKKMKSLKRKKNTRLIANILVLVLIVLAIVTVIGVGIASKLIPTKVTWDTAIGVLKIAGVAISLLGSVSTLLLDEEFFAKKRVKANPKFKYFAVEFIFEKHTPVSFEQLMEKSVQKCYEEWKNEMKKIHIFYLKGGRNS